LSPERLEIDLVHHKKAAAKKRRKKRKAKKLEKLNLHKVTQALKK